MAEDDLILHNLIQELISNVEIQTTNENINVEEQTCEKDEMETEDVTVKLTEYNQQEDPKDGVDNQSNCAVESTNNKKSVLPRISNHVASTKNMDTFYKGGQWSPDGLCIMTNSDDNCIRLYNTPAELLRKNWDCELELNHCLKIMESGTIYDYKWWPAMNSQYPSTCCFVTSCRDQPTHLWDAFDGRLRATYIAKDQVDEVTSAHSVCFSPDGAQLLCGYKRELRLFYTDLPGTKCELWKTCKVKNSGQNGIISNIVFHPDGCMFACACYDKTIGLYSSDNGQLLDLYSGHEGGVTFLKFSTDGNRLFSGSRQDDVIKCWDIRHSMNICNFERTVQTNQRIFFDLELRNNDDGILMSGNTNGDVSIWNVEHLLSYDPMGTEALSCPKMTFKAHKDCANGVHVHPYLPVLATTSGQRHFNVIMDNSGTESEGEDDEIIENKMKFWHLNEICNESE